MLHLFLFFTFDEENIIRNPTNVNVFPTIVSCFDLLTKTVIFINFFPVDKKLFACTLHETNYNKI